MALGKKTGGRDFKKGAKPGPGRPKDTPEKKLRKIALRERLKEYLESGEAAADFEALRKKKPGLAIETALDRIEGRPKQSIEHSGAFALVVKGKDA